MASFRQHVAVSTALGVAYGTAAYVACGIDWATCAIAGGLTGLAGMLPDLDSPRAQPVREVFGVIAALVPLLLLDQLTELYRALYRGFTVGEPVITQQVLVVLVVACYFFLRFGGAWALDQLTIHRGMFHSIPAAFVVAAAAFLLMNVPSGKLRFALAGGPLIGFLSHLIMDELWSVKWFGLDMGLKKSAGTALKLYSDSAVANVTTYAILLGLCYVIMQDPAVNNVIAERRGQATPHRVAREVNDTVVR